MEILLLWRNKDEWRLWKFSSNRWSDVATSRMCCDWKGGGRVLLITFLRFVCSSSTCRAVCSKNFYIFLSPSIFFSLKRKVLRLISYRNGKYIYIHGDMRLYRIIESHTGFIYILFSHCCSDRNAWWISVQKAATSNSCAFLPFKAQCLLHAIQCSTLESSPYFPKSAVVRFVWVSEKERFFFLLIV